MVIFLFLRSIRATIIPAVAVPLSIVGTFGIMYLLGYSLNNLSLMALTISTGFVVDDAIVMVENIDRYLEMGDTPLDAALKGSEQIGFTILSLTVSLIAVLIPLLFMGDIVGRLFREFAVTLAVTILVSAVVSLTLTPMMAAKLLKHKPKSEQNAFYRKSEEWFELVIAKYGRGVQWVLAHQTLTLLITAATFVLTLVLYVVVPKGFFPVQDTGVLLAITQADQSVSFDAMSTRQQNLARTILARTPIVGVGQFLHRHRRAKPDAELRRDPNQPEGQGKAFQERAGNHPAAAAERKQGGRHRDVSATAAGPHRRRPRFAYAVSVLGRRCELGRARDGYRQAGCGV